jgi:hypothetical protein
VSGTIPPFQILDAQMRRQRNTPAHASIVQVSSRKPYDILKDQIDWAQYLPKPGFHVLSRRWVVERTFAWLLFNRRLSRDYERLCATSEAWIYLAMSRLMLRRLVRMHYVASPV